MEMFHCRNVSWMVLFKAVVFADPKFKMAAIEEHSLTLDPIGNKVFLVRNYTAPGIVLLCEWSSTKKVL